MANKNLKELLNKVKYIILSKMRKTLYFYQKKKISFFITIFRLKIKHEGDVFRSSPMTSFLKKNSILIFYGKKEFERII